MENWLSKLRRKRWALKGRAEIRRLVQEKLSRKQPVKIVLGAGHHVPINGEWINTDLPQFDITDAGHWQYIFGDARVNNLLAEHVLEHLTHNQLVAALKLAKEYLANEGVFRVAIPDKNNPDPLYQETTRPGGNGPGAYDHKVFLNINDCEELAALTGFKLIPLEYFDNNHIFDYKQFDASGGDVIRSRKKNYHYEPVPAYTSLIFDLHKTTP